MQAWTRHSRVPSGGDGGRRDHTQVGNKASQTAALLGKRARLQRVRECGGAGGGNMPPEALERRATDKPSDESEPPLTPCRLPGSWSPPWRLPGGQHSRPCLQRACVTGISFWNALLEKHFRRGRAEWETYCFLKDPQSSELFIHWAFIIDEAPVGFPLPDTFPPVSAWWAVVGNMLPLQSISPPSPGPLLQGADVSVSQRPVGDPLTGSPGLSPVVPVSVRWVRLHLPPATTAGGHFAEAGAE